MENRFQINYGPAYDIIHNRLELFKNCKRWVPKQLLVFHKQTRLNIYEQDLNEDDTSLDRITNGEGTRINHYDPES